MRHLVTTATLTGRAVRYGIAGVLATLAYYAMVAGLVESGALAPVGAAALATCATTLLQYLVNRKWIFPTDRSHASAFTRFVAASLLGIGLNTGLMYLAVQVLGWRYGFGLLLATAVVPPTNFLINNHWTFSPRG